MIWTTRQRSDASGLSAIVAGDGPTILLLHGVGLQADAWIPQIDALSRDFYVIAPDMPGHGHSAPPRRSMRLADYTDAALAVAAGPVLVVGHSMGAMIALDMATRHPDRVRGVAALNAIWHRSSAAAAAVQARAGTLDGRTHADATDPLQRWFGDAPSAARDACERWLNGVDPGGYKVAYTVFAHCDGPDEAALATLACPALFMTGAAEPNSTPAMSRAMAGVAPRGRAEIVEGAAHMMPMTHAAVVTAALQDFARQVWS